MTSLRSHAMRGLVALMALGMVACAGPSPVVEDATLGSGKIRHKAVQDAATSYGAQCGLAYRAKRLDQLLEDQSEKLDQVFNFRAVMMPHNVLPPVIQDSAHSLNLADAETMRMADRIVEVVHPARFVTVPPSWRDYLQLSLYKIPPVPDATLLPRDPAEWQVWRRYVRIGWEQGVSQADSIFIESLARLQRDLTGMALYKRYAKQRMITQPRVGLANLGVTGDKQRMRINDRVMRITQRAELQPHHVERWRPLVVRHGSEH